MKLPVTLFAAAILAGATHPARAEANQPSVASALELAAAHAAMKDSKQLPGMMNQLEIGGAIEELARGGDVDDARALLVEVEHDFPRWRGLVIVGYARLGDRAEVDRRIEALDATTLGRGKEGPGLACDVAIAYEALGDAASADARLADAHADCPGYLADMDVRDGKGARALAVLDHDAARAPADDLAAARRVAQRARAGAADSRKAIAEVAAKLLADKPEFFASELCSLGLADARRGWKADARKRLDEALANIEVGEMATFTAENVLRCAAEIGDKPLAVQLARRVAATAGSDADSTELVMLATDWAIAGDRSKARALLARALDPKRKPPPDTRSAAEKQRAHQLDQARSVENPPPPPPDADGDGDVASAPAPGNQAPAPNALAELYTALGDVEPAIRAASQSGRRRADLLRDLAAYAREHKVARTKAITAALALL